MIRYSQTKRDKNQPEIVRALDRVGATALDLSSVGCGCPDILVGFRGMNYLAEIKMPKKQLSVAQKVVKDIWWRGGKVHVLRSVHDIRGMLGI